jgi:hypothetical protein
LSDSHLIRFISAGMYRFVVGLQFDLTHEEGGSYATLMLVDEILSIIPDVFLSKGDEEDDERLGNLG